jgi:hypothetical protein
VHVIVVLLSTDKETGRFRKPLEFRYPCSNSFHLPIYKCTILSDSVFRRCKYAAYDKVEYKKSAQCVLVTVHLCTTYCMLQSTSFESLCSVPTHKSLISESHILECIYIKLHTVCTHFNPYCTGSSTYVHKQACGGSLVLPSKETDLEYQYKQAVTTTTLMMTGTAMDLDALPRLVRPSLLKGKF